MQVALELQLFSEGRLEKVTSPQRLCRQKHGLESR